MRVITLLPSATEIVAALGGAGQLVGISHECDYPGSVQHLPRVTSSLLDVDAPGATLDAEVRRLRDAGQAVIGIETELLRRLQPDLIVTQSLCDVCAVSDGAVHRLAEALDPPPQVLTLEGRDLAGIWADIRRVGAAVNLAEEADELVLGLQSRLRRLRGAGPDQRPRVMCVEWLDPLYLAGHWVPELVEAAGGDDVGARPGSHSRRCEWQDLRDLWPDHVLVMLCGLGIPRARSELAALRNSEALATLSRAVVSIVDGNAYTSRAGPRIVDGAERIRAALSPRPGPDSPRWLPSAIPRTGIGPALRES